MGVQFDARVSMGNLILLVGCLLSASVVWGATKSDLAQQRRDLDRHQLILDRQQELLEKMQTTQAAIVANNTMILEWLARNPPVTTHQKD